MASAIGDRHSVPVFNVGVKAQVMGLVESHDARIGADVIDEASVERIVQAIERKHDEFVIEGHMAHFAAPREDAVLICAVCPIEILNERLEERGYGPEKIRDNLDAEIFQICRTEAEERGWQVHIYDSSRDEPEEFARELSGSSPS